MTISMRTVKTHTSATCWPSCMPGTARSW
ncbi:hypothetical protein [Corynebacterium sp.]